MPTLKAMRDLALQINSLIFILVLTFLLSCSSITPQDVRDARYVGYLQGCIDSHYVVFMKYYKAKAIPLQFANYTNEVCNKLVQTKYLSE